MINDYGKIMVSIYSQVVTNIFILVASVSVRYEQAKNIFIVILCETYAGAAPWGKRETAPLKVSQKG